MSSGPLPSLEIERLVSLPAGSASAFASSDPRRSRQVFVMSDPPGRQLGSAGGTAFLLDAARRATRPAPAFHDWLQRSRKLIVHGSGESRRLPAYAAAGKPLIPIPHLHGSSGEAPDQTLLDIQAEGYERLFWFAPAEYRLMVTCGDVLLRWSDALPPFPQADVLIVGMAASMEEAQRHGVMVCAADDHTRMLHFLQKPDPDTLRSLSSSSVFYLDTGVWLLTEAAVKVLLQSCGWTDDGAFSGGTPRPFDLYGEFGPALGETPTARDPRISPLRCAVLPLPDARFYHFGTNRSLLASTSQLQSPPAALRSVGHTSMESHVSPIVQFSEVNCRLGPEHRHIWIENSFISAGWKLTERHILTNVPPNDWDLSLPAGLCLDFAPVADSKVCVRFYGFDDALRGGLADASTVWTGRPAAQWFQARGLDWDAAGLRPDTDIYDAAIFPLLAPRELTPDFIRWLTDDAAASSACRSQWLRATRLSCRDLLLQADPGLVRAARMASLRQAYARMPPEAWRQECSRLDLSVTARLVADESIRPPDTSAAEWDSETLPSVHDSMFRHALGKRTGAVEAAAHEQRAFGQMRSLIVRQMELAPAQPVRNVLEDQIVWGRSPVRLDLAGGWTDTPPYCLEHGGRVVNMAVDLNGQPPIQVFGRICALPEIRLRSVDLGIDEHIGTYEELENCGPLGGGFGIAKAALALAGLLPRFHAREGYRSLEEQLRSELGGGIELSMVCAVPKGSGLGTSSILAATILGTLSEICGLRWSRHDLFLRTLALEQILTAGGGWQDQVGGIEPGLKLVETVAGVSQKPIVRWLPTAFFADRSFAGQILLYYTGITRVAHGILGEIVRGLFLNSAAHLSVIDEIGRNALFTADALQRNDWNRLCEGIRRSWTLNQRLDPGTNPPAVASILDTIAGSVAACKLLGAGGGGYMLILARDEAAALHIRKSLSANPPNGRARFVDMSVSTVGFQVTRS